MATLKTFWNQRYIVYEKIPRYTGNDRWHNDQTWPVAYQYRVSLGDRVAEFSPEQFPIQEFSDTGELKEWIESNLPGLTGTFYLYTRSLLIQRARRRKKKGIPIRKRGRPSFTRWKLDQLGIWRRPRQRYMNVRNCIQKFEMLNGAVVKLFERKGRQHRPPYKKPRYEVLKKIKDNAKRGTG